MLRLISNITITQVPTTDFPSRNKSFSFDFLSECEINSSWANLTDTANIVFPKNVYFTDGNKKVTWFGKNIIGDTADPITLRGDKIKIELGYQYFDSNNVEQIDLNTCFEGYVSKVTNRIPLEIECEDNMFRLKQIPAPNKVFKSSQYNLQSILQELVKGTGFTISSDIKTSIGDFRAHNETVAQVLDRLQKDYHIESYFRGNELRCSGIVYYPDFEGVKFGFQHNIIEDSLEYRRLEDIKIGVKAYSINEVELNTTRSDGKKKKTTKRLSVFVTKDLKGNYIKSNEETFEGEKRTLYFWNITTESDLIQKAGEKLNRLYYEGFHGKFTTFGQPQVKHGDHIVLIDNILPERNGTYKCKSVTTTFGEEGFRQEIEVDIRVDNYEPSLIASGL